MAAFDRHDNFGCLATGVEAEATAHSGADLGNRCSVLLSYRGTPSECSTRQGTGESGQSPVYRRRRVRLSGTARAGKGTARGRGEPSKGCAACVGDLEEAASLRRGVWVTRRTFSVGTPGSGPHSHQSQAVAKTRGGLDGRPLVVELEVCAG